MKSRTEYTGIMLTHRLEVCSERLQVDFMNDTKRVCQLEIKGLCAIDII